jgi:hypothetical protein
MTGGGLMRIIAIANQKGGIGGERGEIMPP